MHITIIPSFTYKVYYFDYNMKDIYFYGSRFIGMNNG